MWPFKKYSLEFERKKFIESFNPDYANGFDWLKMTMTAESEFAVKSWIIRAMELIVFQKVRKELESTSFPDKEKIAYEIVEKIIKEISNMEWSWKPKFPSDYERYKKKYSKS